MDLHRIISSSSLRTRAIIIASSEISSWEKNNIIFFKPKGFGVGKCLILPSSGSSFRQGWQSSGWGAAARKETRCIEKLSQEPNQISKKQGTVAGAVALIVGTSIGSGILALPKKTSPAGLVPSSVAMTMCWAFLLIEALILVEVNVGLLKRKKSRREGDELEVISTRTMAQETLGEWGGVLANLTYVFLGYTSMVAYAAKSGEILCSLINLPESVCGIVFTAAFAVLISVGGTKATDQVNQWLTASMIGLLVAIEILAAVFGGWSGVEGSGGNWERVPAAIPVLIFSLVYHDLAPVLCAYLGGDLRRIRASVLIGSFIAFVPLLVWNAIALGLSAQVDQSVDPLELLLSIKWGGVSYMVEAFSLLAIGTSIISTLLSFSEFFKEQLSNLLLHSGPFANEITASYETNNDRRMKQGGYCMTMLYGVLPPAMAWAMHNRGDKDIDKGAISRAKPALLGVCLIASCIVLEQIIADLSLLHL
nr:Tyrosine-specific transport protein [Ipomoea batatas]